MAPEIELRLKLIREFCKYCFSYKFTRAGFVYSPCKMVCEVVFNTLLIMKKHNLADLEITSLLNSYLIPNILSDRDWIDADVSLLLAVPDLQAYVLWDSFKNG